MTDWLHPAQMKAKVVTMRGIHSRFQECRFLLVCMAFLFIEFVLCIYPFIFFVSLEHNMSRSVCHSPKGVFTRSFEPELV